MVKRVKIARYIMYVVIVVIRLAHKHPMQKFNFLFMDTPSFLLWLRHHTWMRTQSKHYGVLFMVCVRLILFTFGTAAEKLLLHSTVNRHAVCKVLGNSPQFVSWPTDIYIISLLFTIDFLCFSLCAVDWVLFCIIYKYLSGKHTEFFTGGGRADPDSNLRLILKTKWLIQKVSTVSL
jgi:hypothetical protein